MEAVEIQTRATAPDKITDILRAGELLYVIKKEFSLGLKLSMLEQAKGGTPVLQATQGKNPFSGKVKFMLPSGQEVARTDPGFLRSANHVEFQGRKYKWYCKSYRTTLHFDLEDTSSENSIIATMLKPSRLGRDHALSLEYSTAAADTLGPGMQAAWAHTLILSAVITYQQHVKSQHSVATSAAGSAGGGIGYA